MNKGKRYDIRLKRIISEEYKKGKSVKDIAREYNISQSSIYKWINIELDNDSMQMNFMTNKEKENNKENINYIREISKLRKNYEIVLKENEILKKTISVLIK